ncbi:MAG: hypothetical protein V3U72_01015 [Candidatus Aenigmarchaeota archaeon]
MNIKSAYNNICLKGYKNFSDLAAATEIYGNKALKVSLGGLIVGSPLLAQTKPAKPEIPFGQQLTVKQMGRVLFYNNNNKLEKIRILFNMGDIVGDSNTDHANEGDYVAFDVGSWQEYKKFKRMFQQFKDITLERPEEKMVPFNPMKPGAAPTKIDYGVTMGQITGDRYQITVNRDPDKVINFTDTGWFEIEDMDKPKPNTKLVGSIKPNKIVNPVTRRDQHQYQKRRQKKTKFPPWVTYKK